MCSIMKINIFTVFVNKIHIWVIALSWDIDQNVISHSNCRICKSTTYPEHVWNKAMRQKIKRLSKMFFGVWSMIKRCRQGTLKLTASRMNRWNHLFFACWYKFKEAKKYFNDFWVCVVENKCGLLTNEALKTSQSYELIYELSWLFAWR